MTKQTNFPVAFRIIIRNKNKIQKMMKSFFGKIWRNCYIRLLIKISVTFKMIALKEETIFNDLLYLSLIPLNRENLCSRQLIDFSKKYDEFKTRILNDSFIVYISEIIYNMVIYSAQLQHKWV